MRSADNTNILKSTFAKDLAQDISSLNAEVRRTENAPSCSSLFPRCAPCALCECPGGLDMQDENVCLKPPGFHQYWCPNGASHPDLSNTFPQDLVPHTEM